MKKRAFILLMTLGIQASVVNLSFADHHCNDGMCEYKHKRVEFLAKKLDLTAEQKAKISDIMKVAREQVNAIKKETHQHMKAVLSPEQLVRFEAMKEKHHKHCDHKDRKKQAKKDD